MPKSHWMRVFGYFASISLTLLLSAPGCWAWDRSQYLDIAIGTEFQIEIPRLHPTQFRIGRVEVEERDEDFEQMSPHDLKKYLREHPCPILIGPDGTPYITDEQHRANASTLAEHHRRLRKLQKHGHATMYAKVKDSYPLYLKKCEREGETPLSFEKWMIENNYALLTDRGKPRKFKDLPEKVTDMGNDAYRSLSGALEDKAYKLKPGVYFAQFKVANWLRKKLKMDDKDVDDLLTAKKEVRKTFLKRVSHLLRSKASQDEPWHQSPFYTKKGAACLVESIQDMVD